MANPSCIYSRNLVYICTISRQIRDFFDPKNIRWYVHRLRVQDVDRWIDIVDICIYSRIYPII